MDKLANRRFSTELPRAVLVQLDPKLAELYSTLDAAIASRISALVRKALPHGIDPNRVLKYAFLYATAERLVQGRAGSKEHTRRAKLELAGYIHGLGTGYRDDAEAHRLYRRGRMARQHIEDSLEAVVRNWRVFKQVVQEHRSELPVHLQSRFSSTILHDVGKVFQNMGIATVLDEEDLASEKRRGPERSPIIQTYIWWRLKLAPYRGKWMHELAFAWKMSPAASVKRFRSVVTRVCKGVTCAYRFEEPWESVLSEKK